MRKGAQTSAHGALGPSPRGAHPQGMTQPPLPVPTPAWKGAKSERMPACWQAPQGRNHSQERNPADIHQARAD